MDDTLRRFNGDSRTKEALQTFISSCIDTEALKRIYAKEDISGIADAKIILDKAFEELEFIYGIKTANTIEENNAR